jgi:hypothetical protein
MHSARENQPWTVVSIEEPPSHVFKQDAAIVPILLQISRLSPKSSNDVSKEGTTPAGTIAGGLTAPGRAFVRINARLPSSWNSGSTSY